MTACPNCGTEATPGDRFCQACGYQLSAAGSPPPPLAPDPGEWPAAGDPGLSMPIPMPPPPPPVAVPPGVAYPPIYPGYPSVPAGPPTPAATPYAPLAPVPYAPPAAPPPLNMPRTGYPAPSGAGGIAAPSPYATGAVAPSMPLPPPPMPLAAPSATDPKRAARVRVIWIVAAVVLTVALLALYLIGQFTPALAPSVAGRWYGPLVQQVVVRGKPQPIQYGEIYLDLKQSSGTISGTGNVCVKGVARSGAFAVHGTISNSTVMLTLGTNANGTQANGTLSGQTLQLTYQQQSSTATVSMRHGTLNDFTAACNQLQQSR